MKIAVIGSGVSGLSAAWLLAPHHEVVLFEKDSRLGGHAHTVEMRDRDGTMIPVDTAFVVFSPQRYPNLTKLFEHFNITSVPTNMSLSVSMDNGAFEFSNTLPNGLFAGRENMLSIPFYQFLLEINRFNAVAHQSLREGISPHQTLQEWLTEHGFSEDLAEKYLMPIIGSIWSTPKKLAREFPCGELFTFLESHHLLSVIGHPPWRTVLGGSATYVKRVAEEIQAYGGVIRLNQRVRTVQRTHDHVDIVLPSHTETFDQVIFATHADQTLALLEKPTREEKSLLSKFTYEINDVYLHSDPALMPRHKEAWAAWNYRGYRGWGPKTKKVCLTYNMNRLQHLSSTLPAFVTLNPHPRPKPSLTHAKIRYAHPLSTCISVEMRERLQDLQNVRRSFFCGSYFGYGFHEDGITSAISVAKHFGISPPWE